MYHAVGEKVADDKKGYFTVSRSQFEDQLRIIKDSSKSVLSLSDDKFLSNNSLCITFDDGYKNNLSVALPLLSKYRFPFTVFIVTDFIKKSIKDYLSPFELKELSQYAHIGLHGKTHRPLNTLPPEELACELLESRKYLEDLLGKTIDIMSYPHGGVSTLVKEKIKESGFKLAFSSDWGGNDLSTDPFQMKRIQIVSHDTRYSFKQKIQGKWDWI